MTGEKNREKGQSGTHETYHSGLDPLAHWLVGSDVRPGHTGPRPGLVQYWSATVAAACGRGVRFDRPFGGGARCR